MKKTLLLLLTAVLILSAAGTASAYCIYNKLDGDYEFFGETCAKCYKGIIIGGTKECCPGDKAGCKGDTWISMKYTAVTGTSPLDGSTKTRSKTFTCAEQVGAHGWVEISKKNDAIWCDVFNKDGSVRSSSAMKE